MVLLALRVPPLTASVPPLMVVPPKLALPESVSVPVPTLTREPVPKITPLTSVDKLLPPTVSSLAPNWNEPAPAIEPAVSLLSPAGPVLNEKSTSRAAGVGDGGVAGRAVVEEIHLVPPSLLVMVAFPAVLVLRKFSEPPLLLMMAALSAVLVLRKVTEPPSLLMVALPAVLLSKKSMILVFCDGRVAGRAVDGEI